MGIRAPMIATVAVALRRNRHVAARPAGRIRLKREVRTTENTNDTKTKEALKNARLTFWVSAPSR